MALEQEIAALRDEIQKLNATTMKLLETRVEAIETVRSAAAPTAAPKVDKPKAAPKAEEPKAETPKAEETKAEAPKAEKQPLSSPLADDDLTDAGLKTHVARYVNLGASDATPMTAEERTARMAKVKEVLAHEKIKAESVSTVPQNARKAFRKKISDFEAEITANGWLTAAAESEVADELDAL